MVLCALASTAIAAEPTTYAATFATGGTETLTLNANGASNLLFGDGATTLSSWMIEFQISTLQDPGTFVSTAPAYAGHTDGNNRDGLGIRTSSTSAMRISIGGNDGQTSDALSTTTLSDLSTSPLTLRFAYDATSNTAYLLNVGTGDYVSKSTSDDYSLQSVVTGTAASANVATFYADGNTNIKLLGVTDMSAIAGNSKAFVSYLTTKTVPEPTTATLSLLALCGLAARRRRI